ncbi:hypothetical protein LY78DRAFT_108919 [Colletotrichum sublineola]|nr:hypothetical protein LY78DRAFT_108919 [Colletotrichum sublineola]
MLVWPQARQVHQQQRRRQPHNPRPELCGLVAGLGEPSHVQGHADTVAPVLRGRPACQGTSTCGHSISTAAAGNMASHEGEPADMELFANEAGPEPPSEIPQPLRVLKRFGRGPGGLIGRGAESLRRTSTGTDESLDSAIDAPDEPLVVTKMRGNREHRLAPGSTEVNERSGFAGSIPGANRLRGSESINASSIPGLSHDGFEDWSCRSHNNLPSYFGPAFERSSGHDLRILVPKISVTPEVEAIDDNTTSIWAAIKVYGQICPPQDGASGSDRFARVYKQPADKDINRDAEDHWKYGCIHSMSVQIIPTGNNCILDIIQDNPIPTTLGNNETILLLVHVLLDQPRPVKEAGHVRQRSDELIEDLQYHLGDYRLDYVQVVVKYNHSAFPPQPRSEAIDGVVEMGTRLETSVKAIIKHRNCQSPWSPCPAPTINPVLSITYDCWELEKARSVMRRITTQPTVPHKLTRPRSRTKLPTEDTLVVTRTPPVVPRREASLGSDAMVRQPKSLHSERSQPREVTGAGWRKTRAAHGGQVPSTATCPDGQTAGAGAGLPNYTGILRSPRSMGPGLLRNLEADNSGHGMDRRSVAGGSFHEQGQKPSSRWSWTGWFS